MCAVQDCRHQPGVYVPQLGDEVVYVRRGHHENRTRLASLGEELPEAPWEAITFRGVNIDPQRNSWIRFIMTCRTPDTVPHSRAVGSTSDEANCTLQVFCEVKSSVEWST